MSSGIDCGRLDEVLESIFGIPVDAERLNKWVNGGEFETVRLGDKEVPTLRNLVRQIDERESQAAKEEINEAKAEIGELANRLREKIEDLNSMTATAQTVPPDIPASAYYNAETKEFQFDIPQGKDGRQGPKGTAPVLDYIHGGDPNDEALTIIYGGNPADPEDNDKTYVRQVQRIGTTAQWETANPILKDGEQGWERTPEDKLLYKVGDGETLWNDLPYPAHQMEEVYRYKGSVKTVEGLPTDAEIGDVYDVADGMNYAWNGTKWDALGGGFADISVFTPPAEDEPGKKGLVPAPNAMSASDMEQSFLKADGTFGKAQIFDKTMQGVLLRFNNNELRKIGLDSSGWDFYRVNASASTIIYGSQIGVLPFKPRGDFFEFIEDGLYFIKWACRVGHGSTLLQSSLSASIYTSGYSGSNGQGAVYTLVDSAYNPNVTKNYNWPLCVYGIIPAKKGSLLELSVHDHPLANTTNTMQNPSFSIYRIASGLTPEMSALLDGNFDAPGTMELSLEDAKQDQLGVFTSVMNAIDRELVRPLFDLIGAVVAPAQLSAAELDKTVECDLSAAELEISLQKFAALREMQIKNRELRAQVMAAATVDEVRAIQPATMKSKE